MDQQKYAKVEPVKLSVQCLFRIGPESQPVVYSPNFHLSMRELLAALKQCEIQPV